MTIFSEVQEIKEGEEPEEFWSALGGKGDYPRTRALPLRPTLSPRLFKISDQSGRVVMEEICNFVQEVCFYVIYFEIVLHVLSFQY